MTDPLRVLHVPRPSRISGYFAARLGPPVIDPSTLRKILNRYGLQPASAARNLRLGRRSRTVAVTTNGGKRVIKMYRPQWTPATVRYGHSILGRLQELEFPASPLSRTLEGATWTGIGDAVFAVFDFVPGTNYSLNFLLRGDRLRLTVIAGQTLACLHRRLRDFVPDGEHHLGFVSPTGPRWDDAAWHAAKLHDLKDRSAALSDRDAATLAKRLVGRSGHLLAAIDGLDHDLSRFSLPRLIIHGDYGLHNLLFHPTGRAVPVDFELSRLDWRLNDLISALGKYRYSRGIYDVESMETFVRAYATEFPLTSDERQLLPDAWRLYKLQAATRYWNSYFETGGPTRKLESALDSLDQADWVVEHAEVIRRLSRAAGDSAPPSGRGQQRHTEESTC
jgi:Ser/Thr protein kinase RdoA (MazF antagonist)